MEEEWEMLQKSDMGLVPAPDSAENSRDFQGTEADSEGVIRSDYFALDSETRYQNKISEEDREGSSVGSNNPSLVDPRIESPCGDEAKGGLGLSGIELPRRNSAEFWSDSSSNESVVGKAGDFDGKGELGHGDDAKREVHFGGIEVEEENLDKFWSDSGGVGSVYQKFSGFEEKGELGYADDAKGDMGFKGIDTKHNISLEFLSGKYVGVKEESELDWGDLPETNVEFGGAMEAGGGDRSISSPSVEGEGGEFPPEIENSITANEVKSGEEEKKRVVWWKHPLELLKFCAFRISPVWSFSIAAAVMGFVILGRKLYKMKNKSRSIQLKVSIDDKKVSQFKSRAARLNEAFSVVKHVPLVRASLPAPGGVTPWPAMSLR
eukprot:TRINITY_DN1611_c2_g2_i1.p1 TRINITY_DN1611_c2_g2~~TRINITY_DN1611_c2_g2_i1.p1  ORF type:complete len:378 (-),score=97.39 TRINITY_DN1611_c2_g2_i1:510-1643(-)